MKRQLCGAACAGVVVAAVGLCGSAAAAPPRLVPQSRLNALLAPKDVISNIIGATMTDEKQFSLPPDPAKVDNSACAVLFGLDSKAFGDFEALKFDRQQDGDDKGFDHVVFQSAAIYGDTDTAAKLFHNAFQGVSGCNSVLHRNDDNSDWRLQGPTVTGDRAQWTMADLSGGQPSGWRCGQVAGVQSNVLFWSEVCQYGNPATVTSDIADRIAAAASS